MSELSTPERLLERYRRLLYGATDPMLIEGLRRIVAELEATLDPGGQAASRHPDESATSARPPSPRS